MLAVPPCVCEGVGAGYVVRVRVRVARENTAEHRSVRDIACKGKNIYIHSNLE